jgi:hypothetical protein
MKNMKFLEQKIGMSEIPNGIDEQESWANAKLIEKAPEMYKLLCKLKDRFDYFNDTISVNEITNLINK